MKKQNIPDLGSLVQQAKKGDTEAFGKIYDELVKPVYRYIYYRVDPQIAEDLTEETFLKAWQNLRKYKQGKTPFSSWVFKIAHNLLCDHYRKHQTVDEIDENSPAPIENYHPEYEVNLRLNQVKLRKAIKKLPPNYQQIIVLKYINELENDEIAQVTGKSEGAIRILQFRALKQLRVSLEGKREDFWNKTPLFPL